MAVVVEQLVTVRRGGVEQEVNMPLQSLLLPQGLATRLWLVQVAQEALVQMAVLELIPRSTRLQL